MKNLRWLAIAASLLLGVPAYAQDFCGPVVVDTAGVLRDIPAVEAAAAELARETGAEVRVRVTPDTGGDANLDRHVEVVADTICSSWTAIDGSRRSNLVIFWVTMTRDVGLYYGDQWERSLRSGWPMMLERMKPHLRAGDFDQAFITAIEETADVITAATAPVVPQPRVVTPTPAPVVVSQPVVPREPADLTLLFKILGALVFSVIAWFGFKIYTGHQNTAKREEEELRVAQQGALHNQRLSMEGFETLNRLDTEVSAARKAVETIAAAQTLAAWDVKYHTMSQEGLGIRDRFKAAPDASGYDMTKGEYVQAGMIHKDLAAELQVAIKKFESLLADIVEVQALAGSVPTQFEDQKAKMPSVWQSIAAVKSGGFVTAAAEAHFAEGEKELQQVQTAMAAKDWRSASEHLDHAATAFDQAVTAATKLPAAFAVVSQKVAATADILGSFVTRQTEARASYDAMESRYDDESYASVQGNGSEAEIRYQELSEKYEAAKVAVANKDVAVAEALLQEISDDWDDVLELLTAVTQLHKRLDDVAVAADAELAEAVRSVGVARDYLAQHPKHASSKYTADLEKAEKLIGGAKIMRGAKRVPVTQVLESATQADALADGVLALAEDSVATEQRQIERANRLRKEIPGRMAEVGSYLRNHRGDLDAGLDGRVRELEQELAQASRTADTAAFLAKAAAITAALDALYNTSRQQVEAAETVRRRRREEEKRRREEEAAAERRRRSAAATRSSTSSFGSSSRGFGGGSSSFGSSSRGFGGGSSKW